MLMLLQYGIFFASAGHASLIDYPDAKGIFSFLSCLLVRKLTSLEL